MVGTELDQVGPGQPRCGQGMEIPPLQELRPVSGNLSGRSLSYSAGSCPTDTVRIKKIMSEVASNNQTSQVQGEARF